MEMNSQSTALMDQHQSAAAHEFLSYAERVSAVLHGAEQMGMHVPTGADCLRYQVPENRVGESAELYAPLSWKQPGTEIPAVVLESGEPSFRFTLARDVEGSLSVENSGTGFVPLSPEEAARDLTRRDVHNLDFGQRAAVAWMEWLRPYLDATMNATFDGSVLPVSRAEDGSLYVTAGDMKQTIYRPGGEVLRVGTAGVDVEEGKPEPIRQRIAAIRGEKREEVARMEAEAARRELAE
jgi:hypothetical protein